MSIPNTANGFVVSLQAGERFQYEHYEDLDEAIDAYDDPPGMGWQSIGISAAHDGIPFVKLEASVIMAVRGRRRAA